MELSHIEDAIGLYKRLATYDLLTYKELVLSFLQYHDIKTTEDLKIFLSVLPLSTEADLYCRISENTLDLFDNGNADERISISNNDIEAEVNIITPKNLHSSSSTTNIAKALLFIRKIHNKDTYKQFQFCELSDSHYESMLHICNEKIRTCPNAIVELVKLSLNFAVENGHLEIFTNRICTILFGHIGKSILNAEYLIFDKYSSSLQMIDNLFFLRIKELEYEEGRNGDPYILKSILKTSWFLQETCNRIKRFISHEAPFNLINIDSDNEERYRRSFKNIPQLCGEKDTIVFENLLNSIINITLIDHCYISNEETVKKLFHAFVCLESSQWILPKMRDALSKEVVKISLIKAASLLDRMINNEYHENKTKGLIEVNYDYIINYQGGKNGLIKKLKEYSISSKELLKLNSSIRTRFEFKNKELHAKELIQRTEFDGYFRDLELYDGAIRIGIISYCEQSSVIQNIHNNRKASKEVTDSIINFWNSESDKKNLTPSFFRQTLEVLSMEIKVLLQKDCSTRGEKDIKRIFELISLLKKILIELDRYIIRYSSNIPKQYRPFFIHSFYRISQDDNSVKAFDELENEKIINYNKLEFNNGFFFASACCTPINLQYLKGLYTIYTQKHTDYLYQYEQIYDSLIKGIVTTQLAELNNKSNKLTNNINRKMKELSHTTDIAIQNASQKHLESTTTILGVLAAFLAFVTISINMGKLADNIIEYVCFASTFTGSLILFAILIKHLPNPFEKRVENNTNPHKDKNLGTSGLRKNKLSLFFFNHFVLIVFIWVLIFGISFFFSSKSSTFLREKEQKQDSIINIQKLEMEKYEKKIFELQSDMKEYIDKINQLSNEMQKISTNQRNNQKIMHDIDLKINSNSAD